MMMVLTPYHGRPKMWSKPSNPAPNIIRTNFEEKKNFTKYRFLPSTKTLFYDSYLLKNLLTWQVPYFMEMDCTQTCPGAQVRHVQGVYFLTKCLSMHFIFRVIDSCLDIFKCTNNVQWSKLTTWLAGSQKVKFWESIEPSTVHTPPLSVHVLPCVFLLPKASKQDFCPPMVDKILKPLLAFSFNLVTLPSIN